MSRTTRAWVVMAAIPGNVVAGWAINRVRHGYSLLVGPPALGALVDSWGWTLAGLLLVAVMVLRTLAAVLAWRRAET
jgi:hypothetical protein